MTTERYDAVIVGARCAGAATAMLLARSGLRVLAIDRARHGSDTLSTHALLRAGAMQLARWGLYDSIRDSGAPVVRRTTFHYGSQELPVDIEPDDGIEGLIAPRRTVLDATLVDAARAAGAEVRFGTRLSALHRDHRGRIRGAALVSGHTRQDVEAGIVIGADGVHSTVAAQVGARTYRTGASYAAFIYGYTSGLADRGYHWYFDLGVAAGSIPTHGGHCVFVGMPPARLHAAGLEVAGCYDDVLREVAPELAAEMAGATRAGALRRFAGAPGHLRQPWGPGWALVGDAGYFRDPISAHGISDALRDAELLARAVVRGGDRALAEYHERRDALSNGLFEVTDRMASFDWSLTGIQELHRDLSRAMRAEVEEIRSMSLARPRAA